MTEDKMNMTWVTFLPDPNKPGRLMVNARNVPKGWALQNNMFVRIEFTQPATEGGA